MAYIGKQPVIGNFVKLDAISVVNGQASYTMQNGGANFTEYSNVNQFLVSLNGILQSPTDSFTVSGSTITFASNLVTGDVIDFIIVLGNSLDVGVPSDNTVTTAKLADSSVTTAKLNDASVSLAKLTATGTKDATTFLRGDNTFAEAGGGAMELISTVNVTSTPTSIEIQDCFSSSYENYRVIIKVVPVSGGQNTPYIQFANASGGSSYRTSNYNFGMLRGYYNSATAGTESLSGWNQSNFRMIEGQRTGNNEFQMLDIKIFSPNDSSFKTNYMIDGFSRDPNYLNVSLTMGQVDVVEAHTGIKTFVDSGTFASGSSMSVYGIKK